MARVVAVSGFKKSGKTTLVGKIVRELKTRGYSVGTIKHIHDEDFTLDQPGTDTWIHAQAGSDKVVALSPSELAILEKRVVDSADFLFEMDEFDFVVLEGFKDIDKVARIVLIRDEEEIPKLKDEFTLALVGRGSNCDFDIEEVSGIVDLIEEKAPIFPGGMDCGYCGFEDCRSFLLAAIDGEAPLEGCVALQGSVRLSIDGKRIPLKPFIQDLVGNTVSGIVSALKNTDGRRIEIDVERD